MDDSSLWPEEGNIRINNLWIRYKDNLPPVLKGLSVQIKPGEWVGVVGRTGAGKSTVILSLLRVLEAHKGSI